MNSFQALRKAVTIGAAMLACNAGAQTVNLVLPRPKAIYDLNSQVNWVAFRPKSNDVAVALYGIKDGGKAFVCKSWANKTVKDAIVDKMPSPCFCVAFNADGSRLAWCSWTPGKQIRVAGDLGETRAINCGKSNITALAFDPAMNGWLTSVDTEGVVRIWDSNTGRQVRQLPSGGARGLCVAYGPDGRYLAASYKNSHIRLWPRNALDHPPLTLDGHEGQVNYLAFSPNGRLLASGSADDKVILWDPATGKKVQVLEGQHPSDVECLAFTPDGKVLASADRTSKVVFWSIPGYRPISAFFPSVTKEPVYGMAFSSDGETFVTGSQDKTVRFFATRELGYRMGRVHLLAIKEKVSIKVDGDAISPDPKDVLDLPAGKHTIEVTTEDGSNTKSYPVDVSADGQVNVTVDVRSIYGKLLVRSSSPADVAAAGAAGTASGGVNTALERLMPGRYTVTITPQDHKLAPEVRAVEVRAGETTRIDVSPHLAYGDPTPPTDPARLNQVRVNPRDGAEMVWIPAGAFTMGRKNSDRDAKPPHQVTLAGYWIYRTPVTVGQYRAFCAASTGTAWEHKMPAPPRWGWQERQPMVFVSWQDAVDYSRWAFGDDRHVWLPTEAQYERAMQGPEGREYPWGSAWQPAECVNSVRNNKRDSTMPVGSHAANGFGLFDIAGNVWEWCVDWYDADYYRHSPDANPAGSETGTARLLRGAGWDGGNSKLFRSDYRFKADPETRSHNTGFRCAAS